MAHLRQSAPLPESQTSPGALIRLCPACGDPLVNGRCPECAPAAPARAYGESSGRKTAIFASSLKSSNAAPAASAVDSRRASAEWVTQADDADPQTRKAHPTLVRTALNEAGELARARLKRETMAYPRRGENGARNQTDPRVKKAPDFGDALAHDGLNAENASLEPDSTRSELHSRATTPVSVASALAAHAAHNYPRLSGPVSVGPNQVAAHPSTSKRVRPSEKPAARASQPLEPTPPPSVVVEATPPRVRTLSATGMAAADGAHDLSGLVDLDLPAFSNPGKTLAVVLGLGALLGCLFAALI
jgi:hypothetical protein